MPRLFVLLVVLCAPCLAQQINPTSLKFEAVPPNTSPRESVVFSNTGTTLLTPTVTVSGPPFAIAENRCANGLKPGTHCNVYLTYAPTSVGDSDFGTLTFHYGDTIVTTPLDGHGVSAIPTTGALRSEKCKIIWLGGDIWMTAKVWVNDKYYALPIGEPMRASCTNGQQNVDLGSAAMGLCKGRGCPNGPYAYAEFGIIPDQPGNWTCQAIYDGNGVLAPAGGRLKFQIVTSGGHCK